MARKIAKLHILFRTIGIRPGDKIVLCGKNSSQWCVSFISAVTYGAVIVPILPDFKPDNIQHLVNHSDARLAIMDTAIWDALNPESMPKLLGTLCLADYTLMFSRSE